MEGYGVCSIVPAVTELLVAHFMWLDYDNPAKPIYLYINSPETQNEKMETIGSETEAYSIADTISASHLTRKKILYTINCGMAFGEAAMLLSLGKKGYYRAVQPHSSIKLYLPKVNRSSGAAIDMWIKLRKLVNPKSRSTKTSSDLYIFKHKQPLTMDKIADSQDSSFEKRVSCPESHGKKTWRRQSNSFSRTKMINTQNK
ncbi:hypothetical protein Bca4012_064049 [Brassica carinata]